MKSMDLLSRPYPLRIVLGQLAGRSSTRITLQNKEKRLSVVQIDLATISPSRSNIEFRRVSVSFQGGYFGPNAADRI